MKENLKLLKLECPINQLPFFLGMELSEEKYSEGKKIVDDAKINNSFSCYQQSCT